MTAELDENKSRAGIAMDMSQALGEVMMRFDHFVRVSAFSLDQDRTEAELREVIPECRKVLGRLVALLQKVGESDDDCGGESTHVNIRELVVAGRKYSPAMDFHLLFALGMKRQLPELVTRDGPSFDIGSSGKFQVPGAVALGAPDWVFPRDQIPAGDDSVATIHCYHFLEHLTGDDAISFLREVERVLIPERGVMNFSVPYYNSILMAQNLEHRSYWCEETFKQLFSDDTYRYAGDWRLRLGFQVIASVASRNMALLGQIMKSDHASPVARDAWFYPVR